MLKYKPKIFWTKNSQPGMFLLHSLFWQCNIWGEKMKEETVPAKEPMDINPSPFKNKKVLHKAKLLSNYLDI